jgi:hypothetical protein
LKNKDHTATKRNLAITVTEPQRNWAASAVFFFLSIFNYDSILIIPRFTEANISHFLNVPFFSNNDINPAIGRLISSGPVDLGKIPSFINNG